MEIINVGNIITLLTLFATIILGISDIKRRRAEATKFNAEARSDNVSADVSLMSQIKQASIDLMHQMKSDNDTLREENEALKAQVEALQARIARCEDCLRKLGKTCKDE